MALVIDPLTQVYNATWSLFAASDDFTSVVKTGNRIAYTGQARQPEKTSVSTEDFPEVRLTPMGGEYGPRRDTAGREWLERYEVIIHTGDRRVDAFLYPVRWAVVQALADWETILQALTWKDTTFVLCSELKVMNVGTSEIDIKRNVEGWASVATLEVTMWFTHDNLKGYYHGCYNRIS